MEMHYTHAEAQALATHEKRKIIYAELKQIKKQKNQLLVYIWLLWFLGLASTNIVIFLILFAFSYPLCEKLHKIAQKEKKILNYFKHLL